MTCFRMTDGTPVRTWCKQNNVKYATFTVAMERFGDVDKALEHAKAKRGKRGLNNVKYTFRGKPITSYCDGVNMYQRIRKRIASGRSIESVLRGEGVI